MDQLPNLLSDDEVIYVNNGRVLMPNPTFKVIEFLDALAQVVSERESDWTDESEGWFSQGLDCEVLRFGNQGWQRGRVRLRLEFVPDKPKLLREERPRSREESPRRGREERSAVRDEIYVQPEEVYPPYDARYDTDY